MFDYHKLERQSSFDWITWPAALRIFETYDPVRICDNFRNRCNNEPYKLSSITWTLSSVFTSSGCIGSAMSFEWMKMLRRHGYLMLTSMHDVNNNNSMFNISFAHRATDDSFPESLCWPRNKLLWVYSALSKDQLPIRQSVQTISFSLGCRYYL